MTNSGREATAQYRADKAQSWGPWPICAGAALWRSRNMTQSLSRTHRSRNRQACPHDRGVEGRGVRASITRYYIVMGCPVASLVGKTCVRGAARVDNTWLDGPPAMAPAGQRARPWEPASALVESRPTDPPDRHPLAPREEPPSSAVVADSRTAPAVGTVPADTPPSTSPRSAVPAGTTSAPCWRRTVRPKPSACRSSRLARATTGSTGTFPARR